MQEIDILLTMAEVAIALAGFAGVVTAFQRRGAGGSPPGTLTRFRSMVENSLGAFAFSLVPLPFLLSGASESTTWGACSLLLALFIILRHAFSFHRSGGPAASGGDPRLVYFYYAGSAVAIAVLLVNAGGFLFNRSFAGYFIGLLWVSLHAAMNFFRLTYVGLTSRNDAPG